MKKKSNFLRYVFYYGWIPIVGIIGLANFYIKSDPTYLASNYVKKNKHLIGTKTKYFTISSLTSSSYMIFSDIKLQNDYIKSEKDKINLANKLIFSVKKGKTCSDTSTLNLLNNGVILIYSYLDKFGQEIVEVTINKKFCGLSI